MNRAPLGQRLRPFFLLPLRRLRRRQIAFPLIHPLVHRRPLHRIRTLLEDPLHMLVIKKPPAIHELIQHPRLQHLHGRGAVHPLISQSGIKARRSGRIHRRPHALRQRLPRRPIPRAVPQRRNLGSIDHRRLRHPWNIRLAAIPQGRERRVDRSSLARPACAFLRARLAHRLLKRFRHHPRKLLGK